MLSDAVLFIQPNQVELGQINVPDPGPDEILIRTLYTAVSTGKETRVLEGREHGAEFPLVPGYENVGEIFKAGENVDLATGQLVFYSGSSYTGDYFRCWGGQIAYGLTTPDQVILVPEGTDPKNALYTLVTAIAYHGILRGMVIPGDKVAIVGMGLIGHLAAQCAKVLGGTVIAVDLDPGRLEIARRAGVDYLVDASQGNVENRVKKISEGGVDVAIDATGAAEAVDATARLVYSKPWQPPYPPSGRVVLLGSYTKPVSFFYHPTLFENEPDILPSRYTTFDEMERVVDLIHKKAIKPEVIPAKVYDYKDAPRAYAELKQQNLMRVIFSWHKGD
ncbi:zinc-binding dehydrogenase [candidate division KSB1 bacterium]|nr:zinc-binding dehydrogenase [candidate division KSB1 bacterium]